jgi:hypothetical protein
MERRKEETRGFSVEGGRSDGENGDNGNENRTKRTKKR